MWSPTNSMIIIQICKLIKNKECITANQKLINTFEMPFNLTTLVGGRTYD